MKSTVAAFLALLGCTLSASAVSITINEHTPARLDLSIVWGPTQNLTAVDLTSPGVLSVTVNETSPQPGVFLIVQSNVPAVQDVFSILFASAADRLWSSATLSSFDGVQSLSIPGEDFGARFVYGTPLRTAVPDAGSSMLLLAGTLGAFGLIRFRHRP